MKKAISLLVCLALLSALCSCAAEKKTQFSFFAMDTLMTVTLYGADAAAAKEFEEAVKARTLLLDSLLSATDENSEVYKINTADGGKTEISADTAAVIEKALSAYKLTDGAFDITLYPVLKLWGFTDGLYGVPDADELRAALKLCCCESLDLKSGAVTLPKGCGITLGGIAKGYLGDELCALAHEKNISAVFSLGGNVAVSGEKADGCKWKIAVADPADTNKTVCTVEVGSGYSVVTSGAYERYFEFEGKTYHHIIDTKTGHPAESGVLSATVTGADGALCDALSTAFFSVGYEKAARICETLSGIDCIIITDDGVIHTTLPDGALTLTPGCAYSKE